MKFATITAVVVTVAVVIVAADAGVAFASNILLSIAIVHSRC